MDRLNHVGIVVRDLEASIAWYVEHLGFERLYAYGFPGVRSAFVRRGGFRIEFFQTEGAAPMAAEREQAQTNLRIGGLNHFAIEVDDIDAAIAELEAKGVTIVSPPRDVPDSGGERYAFIHDNERMLIELFQPV
jgi:catechol 2,3-dioxygenase-like lactoylglutathione lyase family enzyme